MLLMPFKTTTLTKKCSLLIKVNSSKSKKWKMLLKKFKKVSRTSCPKAQEPREHLMNTKKVKTTYYRLT